MSASVTATFVTRSAIFSQGPQAVRRWRQILLQLRDQSGDVPAEPVLGAGSTKGGVQLIDVTIGGHARVGLRHAGPAEQRSAAGVAGTRVNLHGRQYT
jgi:hypothetical protein